MSVQGRISKTKKNLYDARCRLDNLLPKDFTPEGAELLMALRDDIKSNLVNLSALKAQIVSKKDKQIEEG